MAIVLNHTIVPAHDKIASAEFFARIFGLQYKGPHSHFAPVQVNGDLTLDFDERGDFKSHHYAFMVSEAEFDAIFDRVKAEGITYGSGPRSRTDGEINHRRGGRGVYFDDPNGHVLEILDGLSTMDNRAFASATTLAGHIRDRQIGCLELLDFFLARAERYNSKLNAIIAWQVEKARERARAADAALVRGENWGPLHGLPMTVKELFNLVGLPTTFGNPVWRDNIPPANAVVVDRLEAAGAVIYGKTNVPYMLADSQSYNDIYGTTNNPWALDCGPGGSSGGEAATLSAGLSALGAGSDIAGSLRNPAHYSGIYGHKPSWGLIPTRGHGPPGVVTPTDISVVGPMARDAEDLALALDILAGPDLLQQAAWKVQLPAPRAKSLKDFRVAVWASRPDAPIDDSVATLFAAAVEAAAKAGAAVDDKARPGFDPADYHLLFMTLLRAATAGRLRDEDFAEQQKIAETLSPDDMSHNAHVARGATISHRGWGRANERRNRLRYVWHDFFQRYDVLLAPVGATAAFPHDHDPDRGARRIIVNGQPSPHVDITWAGLASLCYLPATAAPIGLTARGLPVGLQIIGPEGEDPTTIEFARLLAAEIGGFVAPPGYE